MIEYVLDRIPSLTDRAVIAVRALRRLRNEITGHHDEDSHLGHGRPEVQERKPVEPSIESAEKEPPDYDG
nr:hypothetical protein [Streptomyces antibioticus]